MTKNQFINLLWEELENFYMNERYTANSIKKHMNNTVKNILKELRNHDPTVECEMCDKNKDEKFFNSFWNEINELRHAGVKEKEIKRLMKETINEIFSDIKTGMKKAGMLN